MLYLLVPDKQQVNYACQVIKGAYTHKISVVKPKMEIFDKYNDNLQKALSESVWSANCTSWYKSPCTFFTCFYVAFNFLKIKT